MIRNLKNPNLFLFFAIVSSVVVLFFIGTHTYNVLLKVLDNSKNAQIENSYLNDIRFYDEVLTNSALLAARTGNPEYETRYRLCEPKLDSAIQSLIQIHSLQDIKNPLNMTDSANVHLVAMEHRVFELVRAGKLNEAIEIIAGSEYTKQKASYSAGLSNFVEQHKTVTEQQLKLLQNVAKSHKWFFGLVVLLLAVVWLPVERFIRNSRTQMLEQNKKLESEIQKSKQSQEQINMLVKAIKISADCIAITDKDYQIIFVNDSFCKVYGYEENEIIGQPISVIQSANNLPVVGKDLFSTIEQKKIWTGEVLNKRKNGNEFHVQLSLAPLLNDKEELIAIVGILRDITESKQAEETLKIRESYLTAIIENQPGLVWLKDLEGRFLAVNTAFALSCGKKSAYEMLGKTDYDSWPEERAEKSKSDDSRAISDEEQICVEETDIENGETKWFETWKMPIFDENHKAIGTCGYSLDITERKLAEETLRASQQLIEGIINAIPVRIFWKDKNGIYLGCNSIFANDAGYSDPKDLIGKDDFQMGWRDQAELYRSGDRQVMESGIPILLNEEPQTTPEGKTIILLTNKIPLKNSLGEIYGILGTSMNVTERTAAVQEVKHKNEQLQKLNAEKDKFFSIIAHDLKSPFSGFLGLTQIMAEDLPSLTLTEVQDLAINMKNSATNLYSLLENLLQWAQMQNGSITFTPEVLPLRNLVAESLEMMHDSVKPKGIEIVIDIHDGLTVFADNNMLQTVIRNLVSNAVKFTPKGGKVNVSAKITDEKGIEIVVKDTGIGMSRELVENLFRIDVKTGRKGTEGEPSTGLGLLLCKEFVEKHGGKLWVESEVEKGSAFYFTIP